MPKNAGSEYVSLYGREKTTEEYVREKLGFLENYKLEAILSLGMPAVKMPAYQLEELPMEKVKWEKF